MNSPKPFTLKPAQRTQVPVLVGLCGPSGCGKTYSALRIATGIQSVVGGEVGFIDTETRRGLHYADYFKFLHLDFQPPFSSLRYIDAIKAVKDAGCRVCIIDSMSHEHEGEGGMIDYHEAEHKRMGGRESTKMLAWAKPKSDRRKLRAALVASGLHFVCCFRSKSVAKPVKKDGKIEVQHMGFVPITGEEFPFEMTLNAILPPNSGGTPDWHPEFPGERQMVKLPKQFEKLGETPRQLDEALGERLAKWAGGGGGPPYQTPTTPEPQAPDDDGSCPECHGAGCDLCEEPPPLGDEEAPGQGEML